MVGAGVKLGNVAGQTAEFKGLSDAIDKVGLSLANLSSSSAGHAQKIEANLKRISGAVPGSAAGGTSPASSQYAGLRAQIPPGTPSQPPADPARTNSFGSTAASWLGGAVSSDFSASVAMAPLRFIRDRMQSNRNVVLAASGALSMSGLRTGGFGGASQTEMLEHLGKNIGGVKGSPSDLIGLLANAGQYGASYGFGNAAGTGVRGAGFFQGIQQAQVLNPGASVQSMVSAIGGQAANTGAQQQSMMMTGGAYSMIGSGGRQKSLTQWADSIMKWLVDLRPGPDRGKPFNYGQLMSQYYPGSNIDAWFDVNQVSQEMREYWWTYSLGKANKSISIDEKGILSKGAKQTNNLSALRLESTNVMTQGEFTLGSKMSGAYGNREQSNRVFNEMIQSFLIQALPAALMSGPLASIQFMPDIIEELLMGLLERAPSGAQTLLGGGAIASMLLGGGDGGDVGDMPGAYGAMGGTTTSGMHPDMKRKIGAMQRANPRIKITSGLRDTGLQQRLKKAGHKNVSGKASAHTRGMAADLGPRSEYGWISKNASRFGLKSGKSAGEPWHVGMGDHIGDDVGDPFTDIFKGLFGGDSGGAEGMFDIMSALLGALTGALGGSLGGTGPTFDEGLYERLSQKGRTGVAVNRTVRPPTPSQGLPGQSPLPGVPTTANQAGTNAAIALFNAGFKKREDLVNILAIAKRESGWNPKAQNPNGEDKGLMQINNKAHASRIAKLGVTDLLDAGQNAQVAYDIFNSSGNYLAWNFSETSAYWGAPLRRGWANPTNTTKKGQDIGGGFASPFVGTNKGEAEQIVNAANITGLGDMPEYQTPTMGENRRGNVVFVNTFNLQGVGGGGPGAGIDVRRTVTMMADHLEGEMKNRLSRVS